MKSLKKRIANLDNYLNTRNLSTDQEQTIRGIEREMSSGRISQSLDRTRDNRTTNKIKTLI